MSALREFLIAGAGPVSSLVLAGFFYALAPATAAHPPAFALLKYLASINAMMGLFNLVPGVPLDGGRVLEAIVWA